VRGSGLEEKVGEGVGEKDEEKVGEGVGEKDKDKNCQVTIPATITIVITKEIIKIDLSVIII
jgi:hypothetical protein